MCGKIKISSTQLTINVSKHTLIPREAVIRDETKKPSSRPLYFSNQRFIRAEKVGFWHQIYNNQLISCVVKASSFFEKGEEFFIPPELGIACSVHPDIRLVKYIDEKTGTPKLARERESRLWVVSLTTIGPSFKGYPKGLESLYHRAFIIHNRAPLLKTIE